MSARFTTILGVDCATRREKVGLARAYRDGPAWRVSEVRVGGTDLEPAEWLARWVERDGTPLIALDAPLGWPLALGAALSTHRAGSLVHPSAAMLFARDTDRVVRQRYGKRPLEVGADRIARTAQAALVLLDDVRARTGRDVPLAWDPQLTPEAAAIEVYPAATLAAHGVSVPGYKRTGADEARATLQAWLERWLVLPELLDLRALSDHGIDALTCIVAGVDFASGNAAPPEDRARAEVEGWIWVRRSPPQQSTPQVNQADP